MTTHLISNLAYIKTDISVKAVARYFGGSKYKVDEETNNRISHCIDAALELASPKAAYAVFQVKEIVPGKTAVLEKGWRVMLPECFDDPGTQFLSAAIGTLGQGLEKRCRDLAGNGKIYESTLFDAIGTVMLDLLSDRVCKTIEDSSSKSSLMRGGRFSPGIDGYPLEQQNLLFEIVDSQSVGVLLNSSAVMIPTKSISFFMALTNTPGENTVKYKCSVCRLSNCQFRKVSHYE